MGYSGARGMLIYEKKLEVGNLVSDSLFIRPDQLMYRNNSGLKQSKPCPVILHQRSLTQDTKYRLILDAKKTVLHYDTRRRVSNMHCLTNVQIRKDRNCLI